MYFSFFLRNSIAHVSISDFKKLFIVTYDWCQVVIKRYLIIILKQYSRKNYFIITAKAMQGYICHMSIYVQRYSSPTLFAHRKRQKLSTTVTSDLTSLLARQRCMRVHFSCTRPWDKTRPHLLIPFRLTLLLQGSEARATAQKLRQLLPPACTGDRSLCVYSSLPPRI